MKTGVFPAVARTATMADTIRQTQFDKTFIRRRQVEQLVQRSRSTIYAAVKNQTFPAPYRTNAAHNSPSPVASCGCLAFATPAGS